MSNAPQHMLSFRLELVSGQQVRYVLTMERHHLLFLQRRNCRVEVLPCIGEDPK
jgi:hypothetical protein